MQGGYALIAMEKGSLPCLRMRGRYPITDAGQLAHLVVEGQLTRIAGTGRPSGVHSRSTQPLASSSSFFVLTFEGPGQHASEARTQCI